MASACWMNSAKGSRRTNLISRIYVALSPSRKTQGVDAVNALSLLAGIWPGRKVGQRKCAGGVERWQSVIRRLDADNNFPNGGSLSHGIRFRSVGIVVPGLMFCSRWGVLGIGKYFPAILFLESPTFRRHRKLEMPSQAR